MEGKKLVVHNPWHSVSHGKEYPEIVEAVIEIP